MSGGGEGFGEERLVLAGEYVLGTLPADERAHVDEEIARDPALRGLVAEWERYLMPLAATAAAVTPPAALWRRIERSMRDTRPVPRVAAPRPAAARAHPVWPRRSSTLGASMSGALPWKLVAAASVLLAVGIGIGLATLPNRSLATVPVAALSPPGGPAAAFVVEARSDGVVSVLPLHPSPVPSDRDLELWSLAAGDAAPRPLGVLPSAGRTLRVGMLPRGASRILVSLEPRGGSPTGLPTGPVLYGGAVSIPD